MINRIFLLVVIGIFTVNAIQCNNTHLEFLSSYSLGKQDELNKTFEVLQKQFPTIPAIKYNQSAQAQYTITDVKPAFYYRDSKQQAQIVDNDTIIVFGGSLQVDFTFKWQLKRVGSEKNGNGRGFALSKQIMFGKNIYLDRGFYIYNLTEVYNVTFNPNINLTRVDADSFVQDIDLVSLSKMMNSLDDKTDLKTFLGLHINDNYKSILNKSLHDEKYFPDPYNVYVWQDPYNSRGNLTFNYSTHPTGVKLDRTGITLTYTAYLQDYKDWQCIDYGFPSVHYNTSQYGGIQQFLSYNIYENSIRYAISKSFLDTKLNKKNWESRFFQFYAGDLYEVIPTIANQFKAIQPVNGDCFASLNSFGFDQGPQNTMKVKYEYACALKIQQKTVTNFVIYITFYIQGDAKQNTVEFNIKNWEYTTSIIDVPAYKVENPQLAKYMIKHSLNRLPQAKVIGSGWKVLTRDYPNFLAEKGYSLVYDSSHINSADE